MWFERGVLVAKKAKDPKVEALAGLSAHVGLMSAGS